MNNEPVAWMRLTCDRVTRITLEKVQDNDIPLYTHPVKELTNEEVNKILESFNFPIEYVNPYDFARAILRKAQEK